MWVIYLAMLGQNANALQIGMIWCPNPALPLHERPMGPFVLEENGEDGGVAIIFLA